MLWVDWFHFLEAHELSNFVGTVCVCESLISKNFLNMNFQKNMIQSGKTASAFYLKQKQLLI